MFPVPGQPNEHDPETRIREIEDDPLSRITWWLLDKKTALMGSAHPERPLVFTHAELAYLQSQRLAHIALVDGEGRPDAVPVGFTFDGTAFYVGGVHLSRSALKRVALVIDELLHHPNEGRGIRIYGRVEVLEADGMIARCLRIIPQATRSWGINATAC